MTHNQQHTRRQTMKKMKFKRLAKAALTIVWVTFLALVLGGYRPAEARRSNITETSPVFEVFGATAQALTTVDVTGSVNVPVGGTEGAAALFDVQGLTGTNSVTVTRLERTKSSETKYGYPVPGIVQKQIVITANGPNIYFIAWDEGVEYFTFNITTSQASGVKVYSQVVTQ